MVTIYTYKEVWKLIYSQFLQCVRESGSGFDFVVNDDKKWRIPEKLSNLFTKMCHTTQALFFMESAMPTLPAIYT